MKRILCMTLLCLVLAAPALGEYAPLPVEGPAPYAPQAEGFDADGLGYQDESITVRAETIRRFETNITVVRITVQDASQVRTAMAGKYPGKTARPTSVQAKANNGVLTLSGDFYAHHNQGIVMRGGKLYRNNPHKGRDTLTIDWNGDFHIIHPTTKETWAPYQETVREAFCFGPGLVVDGVKLDSLDEVGISCGAKHGAVRMVLGQTGPLSYLAFATEGPEHEGSKGLTILEAADVAYELGCINAYNLDGGATAAICLGEQQISSFWKQKERPVSDVIYFATLVPDGGQGGNPDE